MAHIGNQVATAFTSFDKQTISGDGTAVYTLSHAVANEQELEVYYQNVRQEGGAGKAFTVSANQITFSENIPSGQTAYINFQGKAVQTIVPPDGSVTTAKIADDAVTSAKLDTNIEVSGILSQPNKEYFRVNLTTKQTNGTDTGNLLVNFASNGTVVYDTLGNWDASTNSYQFGSSDGVYLIHFSIGLSSPTTTTETLRDVASYVTFSSDNFSSLLDTPAFGSGGRPVDQSDGDIGGVTLSSSSIFKATATGIKIRLSAWVNTDGGAWTIAKDVNETTGANNSALIPVDATFLEVVRIA